MHNLPLVLLRTPTIGYNQLHAFDFDDFPDIFMEGLYISSKDLYDEYIKSRYNEKKSAKLVQSLFKYWIRNCTRCTPFGTMAGLMLLDVSTDTTAIILNEQQLFKRSIRLDMDLLHSLAEKIGKIPEVRQNLKFFPNNTIYQVYEEFRYIESVKNGKKKHHILTSAEKADYLLKLIQQAKTGATIHEMSNYLCKEEEVDFDEASEYVNELIDSQFFKSRIEPNITGDNPLEEIIRELENACPRLPFINNLNAINTSLKNPVPHVNYYINLRDEINSLFQDNHELNNVIQADLSITGIHAEISKVTIDKITQQCKELFVFSKKHKVHDQIIFIDRFKARFNNETVPLTLALDPDFGVGYSTTLENDWSNSNIIDDLYVPNPPVNPSDLQTVESNAIQRYTSYKYNEFLSYKQEHIEILEEELDQLKDKNANFPGSMYILGSLLKNGEQKDGFNFNIKTISGPNAASLISRFAHTDVLLAEKLEKLISTEQHEYPDAIYAEIVHLPQARVGNVLFRPVLREYEIPYVGKSGVDENYQIPLEDIYVYIDQEEVILRSKKLDKRIIPRLTNAHNFVSGSLPVYKFLCDLQMQGLYYANEWDWGMLANFKYLPRVTYKNLIFRRARWNIYHDDIFGKKKTEINANNALTTYIENNNIPRNVSYSEGDNELLLDLQSELGQNLLIQYLKKSKSVLLKEFIFNEGNCIVKDAKNNVYTNEILIPLTNEVNIKHDVHRKFQDFSTESLSPNDDWLYFKVYAGNKFLEEVLMDKILPFVESSMGKSFDGFFFIRYRDSSNHLRLRFHNTDKKSLSVLQEVFTALLQPELESRKLKSISIDTYEPEYERYGGHDLIREAENLFYNDSVFVLRFLNLTYKIYPDTRIFLLAMRSADGLMEDFGLTIVEKHELSQILRESYFKEFHGDPNLKRTLNDSFRKHRAEITEIMNGDIQNENILKFESLLSERTAMNKSIVVEIYKRIKINRETTAVKVQVFNLLSSYIHMAINRIFSSNQRKHELFVYHLLERHYNTKLFSIKSQKQLVN
jgi:thiopeptide-type bacteriocin biosynthesis protein